MRLTLRIWRQANAEAQGRVDTVAGEIGIAAIGVEQ